VFYFFVDGNAVSLRQRFKPFEGVGNGKVASMGFVLGDVSVVFTGESGENVVFSLYVPKGGEQRHWGRTKNFPKLPGTPEAFACSMRNKAFVVTSGRTASLRYSTTEEIRWEETLSFEPVRAVIPGKQDRIVFLDSAGAIHLFSLSDPHPETSWRALFGKLWYEGASEPKYDWQSTGGTDDFEPKLSLVPLIVGTLKGTFYALLFALPVALFAALYTSVFLEPRYKRLVKPVMEIMASLPSVVLGFIAALWLAPILETRVPSIIAMIVMVPSAAFLFGWLWSGLPYEKRRKIRYGYEFFVFVPVFLLAAWGAWHVGPLLERAFFSVTDPATGERVADFRLWWPAVTGLDFQQRNSLVIGFIMGFAVIPIIFTITEDALSNVPPTLISASMALGGKPLADGDEYRPANCLGGYIFGGDDRSGPRHRRDDDCRDGDRQYADHGYEYLLWHAYAFGEHRGRIARGSPQRYSLSHVVPWRDAALPDDLRREYDCRGPSAAAA
jgi:phosphate transport system permease protein